MSTAAADAPLRGFFPSRDGLQLYHEIWPALGSARATLLVVHGYGEHCGRYGWPIAHLRSRGFDCVAFDYRGHGQAAGARGHCYHFEEYLGDLEAALALARTRSSERPLLVLAHSHGALVVMRYLLEPNAAQSGVRGVVLTSPFFALAMKAPVVKVALGRVFARVAPRLALRSNIPAEHLSHERAVVEAYRTDRWVHGMATARWFTEASASQDYCLTHAGCLTVPLLMLLAGDDRIASAAHSRAVFEAVGSADKKLIEYPGYFHEVLSEIGREQVFRDLEAWLLGHCA